MRVFDWIRFHLDPARSIPTAEDFHRGQLRAFVGTGGDPDSLIFGRDDGTGTMELVDLTLGGSSYTDEMAQDAVAASFAAGTHSGIDVVYNDGSNSLSITNTRPAGEFGGYVSGRYYTTASHIGNGQNQSTAGNALTANTMVASLFPVYEPVTFDEVSVQIITGVAATTIRLGVYAVGTDGLPGSRIADWGTVASTGAATNVISISWSPSPGWYYLVQVSNGAPSTVRMASGLGVNPFGADTRTHSGNTDVARSSAGSSAALPASFGATPTATGTHRPIWLRVA